MPKRTLTGMVDSGHHGPGTGADNPARVVVADRSLPFCRALQALLATEPGLEFAGCAGTVPGLLEMLASEEPQVLVIDAELAAGAAGPLLSTVRAAHPQLRLVLTGLVAGAAYEHRVAAAAGVGYVRKDEGPEVIAAAIRAAARVPGLRARARR